jgi:hypothetical protein
MVIILLENLTKNVQTTFIDQCADKDLSRENCDVGYLGDKALGKRSIF